MTFPEKYGKFINGSWKKRISQGKARWGLLQFKASPRWRQVIEECYGHMDQSRYPGLTPEKLAYAVDMGLLAMVQLSMRYVEAVCSFDRVKGGCMAPADNIRQRDQRVIRKFEKKKGRHRKMKKNVKRLIAGAVVLW